MSQVKELEQLAEEIGADSVQVKTNRMQTLVHIYVDSETTITAMKVGDFRLDKVVGLGDQIRIDYKMTADAAMED